MKIGLIGAGPLGLELAVALKGAGISYVQFESGQIGSTMQWWAPGTRWFSSAERISIAGVPLVTPSQEKATREEYLAYLRGVVEQFALEVQTDTLVTGVERVPSAEGGGFLILTRHALIRDAAAQAIRVDKVILATGGTATPNLLNIPGERLPHVSHYFQDPHSYFQKELLIVGGRNSAVEAALRCYRAGARVSFNYRGAGVDAKDIKYWLYPEFSGLMKSGKIRAYMGACPAEISPTHVRLVPSGRMESVREQTVRADFVLLLTGYLADMSLPRMAGVTLSGDELMPSFNDQTMETNVPGVYIAGTAIAGTQRRYRVFLENCHVHVGRIVAHLTGNRPPEGEPKGEVLERPES